MGILCLTDGLVAPFVRLHLLPLIVQKAESTVTRPRLSCIAIAKHGKSLIDHNDDGESARFDAKFHLNLFHEFFRMYQLKFDKWVLCIISGNNAVKRRIDSISLKPGIRCYNHKLNFEVNPMISNDLRLSAVLSALSLIIKTARHLRNAVVL